MVSFALARPRLAGAIRRLPAGILLAVMAALFAFGGDRAYFYRSGMHNYNSAKTMAIAENLSPAHGFRLFSRVRMYEDGGALYKFYSRFPVGGYALINLAAAPFGDDLGAKILAGRTLALIMFAAAAMLVYLAVARIASDGWIALAVSLLAFSGYYALYYSDGVFNEGVMDLFRRGARLSRHGRIRARGAFSAAARQDVRRAAFGMARVRAASAVHRARIWRRGGRASASARSARRRRRVPCGRREGGRPRRSWDAHSQPLYRARNRRARAWDGAAGFQPNQRIHRVRRRADAVGAAHRSGDNDALRAG